MSFSLSSTMDSVSAVEAAAEKLAEEAGLDEDERFRFTMAVREAAVNAVLHGNEYDPAKQIAVSLENTGADAGHYRRRPGQRSQSRHAPRSAGPGEPAARHRPRHLPHPQLHG
jgi:two-component sensor histidine kinase